MADEAGPVDTETSTGTSFSGICQGVPWCSITWESKKKDRVRQQQRRGEAASQEQKRERTR